MYFHTCLEKEKNCWSLPSDFGSRDFLKKSNKAHRYEIEDQMRYKIIGVEKGEIFW